LCLFFFFSSRRRHTRWPRDWSSDVCSSDLGHIEEVGAGDRLRDIRGEADPIAVRREQLLEARLVDRDLAPAQRVDLLRDDVANRSEERRVGKESRARGAGYRENKNKSAWWR